MIHVFCDTKVPIVGKEVRQSVIGSSSSERCLMGNASWLPQFFHLVTASCCDDFIPVCFFPLVSLTQEITLFCLGFSSLGGPHVLLKWAPSVHFFRMFWVLKMMFCYLPTYLPTYLSFICLSVYLSIIYISLLSIAAIIYHLSVCLHICYLLSYCGLSHTYWTPSLKTG